MIGNFDTDVVSMCTSCSVVKYYNRTELAEVKASLMNTEGAVILYVSTTSIIMCTPMFRVELRTLEEIGQGAFGRVYKAVWQGSGYR